MDAPLQLPLESDFSLPPNSFIKTKSIKAPETSRITVKLDGSMELSPKAKRQKIEFAAKAKIAMLVVNSVLAKEFFAMI